MEDRLDALFRDRERTEDVQGALRDAARKLEAATWEYRGFALGDAVAALRDMRCEGLPDVADRARVVADEVEDLEDRIQQAVAEADRLAQEAEALFVEIDEEATRIEDEDE